MVSSSSVFLYSILLSYIVVKLNRHLPKLGIVYTASVRTVVYRLPQASQSGSIRVRKARKKRHFVAYKAYIDPVPEGALDRESLRARIEWANTMRKNRNITSRLMAYLNDWKEKCILLLKGNYKGKKEKERLRKDIAIEEGILNFGYDEVHGPNGVREVLAESVGAMMELRLLMDYGEYLSINLKRLRRGDRKGLAWKISEGHSIQWEEVAKTLEKEEAEMKAFHEPFSVKGWLPKTPLLDEIAEATTIINNSDPKPPVLVTKESLAYEIQTYAERCNYCHSGIEDLIKEMQWHELAERIISDLGNLNLVYQHRPSKQLKMCQSIRRFQYEWVDACYPVGKRVVFATSEKANEKVTAHSKAWRREGDLWVNTISQYSER